MKRASIVFESRDGVHFDVRLHGVNFAECQRMTRDERRLRDLYFTHDLGDLLANLPAVRERVEARERAGAHRLLQRLKRLCGAWRPSARYSPQVPSIAVARAFVTDVREVWPCIAA